jgi:hypothetical protein
MMQHDSWPELRAAASPDSGLNAHEYASKLLLQLNRDMKGLPDPGIFAPRVSVTDRRFLELTSQALAVADGLRARSKRTGNESSALHRELDTVLRQIRTLLRRLDMASPQETLDRYFFNEAALDWMDTLKIHPPGPGGSLSWTWPRSLLSTELIHKTLFSNDDLLKEMLCPPSPMTTGDWVRATRHWQSLHREWVPVLQQYCTQSATISGELEPV